MINLLRTNPDLQLELRNPAKCSYALFRGNQQKSAYLDRAQFIRWFNDTLAPQLIPK